MGLFDSIGALGSRFGKWVENVDPIGHGIANFAMFNDSKAVRETADVWKNIFGENSTVGKWGGVMEKEAQKNVDDPDAGIMKAGAVAAAIFGGMAAGGESAAGGSAASGTGAGAAATGGSDAAYLAAADEAGGMSAAYGTDAGYSSGVAGGGATGGATTGAAAPPASTPWYQTPAAKTAATTVGTNLLSSALQPKPPKATDRPTQAMPDPQATAEARKRKIIEQSARRGRVSTILTSNRGDLG
jgi:hypothetical protein